MTPPAAGPDRVEPAPRRVRGRLGGVVVFDTVRASYGWENPHYPQYYVPVEDVTPGCLVGDGLRAGGVERPGAVRVHTDGPAAGTARFEWDALDAWFEEDEQVFVHPRSPYVRVDALRSHRHVVVALGGTVLADTRTPVLVFETGLRTRYYVDRTDVDWTRLEPSPTRTACPYKGTTSGYWSVRDGGATDVAWAYDFPTAPLLPVAGLLGFYDERLDVTVDGVPVARA